MRHRLELPDPPVVAGSSGELPLDTPSAVNQWLVFNASGVHTATYTTEGGAKSHLDCWPSGMSYRAG